jgi:hypothetical protein
MGQARAMAHQYRAASVSFIAKLDYQPLIRFGDPVSYIMLVTQAMLILLPQKSTKQLYLRLHM